MTSMRYAMYSASILGKAKSENQLFFAARRLEFAHSLWMSLQPFQGYF